MSDTTLSTTEAFFQGDVAEGIERIRRRLLDLSNRNRLLNFRHTKKSSLRVVDELPDQLFDVLSDGREFSFAPVPKPRTFAAGSGRGLPLAVEHAATVGISTAFDLPHPPVDALSAPRHADREIQTLHYAEELEGILRSMASAARLAIEETGSNMLYLVLGFLEWYDTDQSSQARTAPLLLFPVALERCGPIGGMLRYSLRHSGEDVFANLCLQEKLKQDYGLVLPDLRAEEFPEAYFAEVARLVAGQERWSVRRQATLTLLSFGKMLMYRDLDSRNWSRSGGPAAHPLVRELFEGRRHEHTSIAHDYRIDELEKAAALPVLIENADSSQHSVLVDAREGRNLVVAGPPGTGKSQTITNLIAAAISEGKRVLFVSEKLAALEVVRHRLDRAGLGAFCLELHSHKTQKKALVEDLRTRLNVRGHFRGPALLEEKLVTLKEYKRDLGAYADMIGRRFGQFDQTVHELLWAARRRRSALPEVSARKLDGIFYSGADSIGLAAFEQLRGRLGDFATHLSNVVECRGAVREHPWFGVSVPDFTFRDQHQLIKPLEELCSICGELEARLTWLEKAGVTPEKAPAWLLATVTAVEAIRSPSNNLLPELFPALDDGPTRTMVDNFCARVRRYRVLFAEIREELGTVPELSAPDARLLAAQVAASSRALTSAHDLATLRSESDRVRSVAAALRACTPVAAALERVAGHAPTPSRHTLPLLQQAFTCVAAAPFYALVHRSHQLECDGVAAELRGAEEIAEPIRQARAKLATRIVLDLAPTLADARRHASAAANARWWRPFDSEWKAARRALATMSIGNQKITAVRAKSEFQTFAVHLEKVRVFEADTRCRELCGSAFRGIDTPFAELAALADWHALLRRLGEHGPAGETLVAALWSAPSERLRALGSECGPGSHLSRTLAEAEAAFGAIRSTLHEDHRPSANETFPAIATGLEAVAANSSETVSTLKALGMTDETPLNRVPDILHSIAEMRELESSAFDAVDVAAVLGSSFAGTETDLGPVFQTLVFHIPTPGGAPEVAPLDRGSGALGPAARVGGGNKERGGGTGARVDLLCTRGEGPIGGVVRSISADSRYVRGKS